MDSDIDIPSLPFKKPAYLGKLERMSLAQREAMDPYEAEERIEDAGNAIAEMFQKSIPNGDYDGCVGVVASALSEMGSSLGGQFGTKMVAKSETTARHSCRLCFPSPEEQD